MKVVLSKENLLYAINTSMIKKKILIGKITGGVCYITSPTKVPAMDAVGTYSGIMKYPFDYIHFEVDDKVYQTTRGIFKEKSQTVRTSRTKTFIVMKRIYFGLAKARELEKQKLSQGDLF